MKELLEKFAASVERFIKVVASLDQEVYLKKIPNWSPRDMVAHLAGWNRYIIEGSKQIMKEELPFYDIDPGENYSKVNALLLDKYPDKDKQKLLEEMRASAIELKEFLRTLEPGQWSRDYGVRHKGELVTIQGTIEELIEDYNHHGEQMKTWAKQNI